MEFTAKEIAGILGGTVEGNPDAVITGFARIENGKPGTISFYANPKYEKYVYTSQSSALIVNSDFTPREAVTPTLIRVANAYEAVAALLDYVTNQKRSYRRHRSIRAHIAFSASLGKKVYVGDFAYIGKKTTIGECTKIYEHVYIGEGCQIGHHCIFYPGVRIYPGMVIGNNVILHANTVIGADGFGFAPVEDGTYKKIEHTGNVIIGNNVEIGANSCVDKSQIGSTIIHDGVKIDNLCQVAHNVELGENTVMCGQAGIAGSTKVGKHCILAGQSGLAGHITLPDNTTVGAQAGVISSIKQEGQAFMGTPALPHREYLRSYAIFRRNGKEHSK